MMLSTPSPELGGPVGPNRRASEPTLASTWYAVTDGLISEKLLEWPLRHAYLSTTGTYLEGISSEEIIGAIHGRKASMMHASTGLEL